VRAALLAALAAVLLAAAPAGAAEPRTSLYDVEDEVMCTTCNVPLNIAESPKADQQRQEIRDLIAQGLTKEQVKARLEAVYGPQVLALPPDEGFSLAAYAVPIAVVGALVGLLLVLLPRWRRRVAAAPAAAAAVPQISAAEAARLDEDLARWDR
jgi:cytochrome c-type biogenesis protein CcmH/NrfF